MKHFYLTIIAMLFCLTVSAGWGDEMGVQPKPTGTNDYGTEYVIGTDGTIWFYYYHPSSTKYEDLDIATYQMCLQAIDKDGNLLFGDAGKVISSYENWSYTVVNQYLHANSDGTVTMVVSDCRNSSDHNRGYTAYRFRPDGTSVWDEEGVNLDEAMETEFAACMTFCELSDGSTAFAWQHDYNGGCCVEIQKVSADGKCMYKLDDTRLAKKNGYYVYPYMVPSEDGSFILVYGYSSEYYLRAMRYNSDGTKAWASETKVYGGGWGSIMALQARMTVNPGPDNGVIVTWNDDRSSEGYYSPYLAYIKKDGTSAFTNADGKPDIKLSYEEWSAHPPVITLSKDGLSIYAIFDQFSQNQQNFQQLTIQKINMSGELLWGDNGIQLEPLADHSLGSCSVQNGKDGEIMCFYQEFFDYHHIDNLYTILNEETGAAVNADKEKVRFRNSQKYRAGLESTYNTTDNTILLYWEEDPEGSAFDSKTKSDILIKMDLDGNEIGKSTGISNVEGMQHADARSYSISGRIMSALKKGDIYIHNGKKYIK